MSDTTEVVHLPTVHSPYGGSAAKRVIACPASVQLSEGIPDPSSPYAREGTAAHELAATLLLEGGDAAEHIGQTILVEEEHEIEVTEEMAEAVQVYVDRVREVAAMGNVVRIEQYFDLSPLNPPTDKKVGGTADAVVYRRRDKHLDVMDYKHGQGVVVEAVGNEQLREYALGAVVELKAKPETITVHIVQPRAHHDDGPIRTDTFTWDELVEFKNTLWDAIEKAESENPEINPGDHCKFCTALPVCPAHKEHAVEVAQAEFEVMDQPGTLPEPTALDDDQLRVVLDNKDRLEKWLKAVYEHVRTRMEQGEEFPGYKLVEKRAYRRWVDEEKAGNYLQRKLGKRGAYEEKLLSPAKAEKALKAEEGEVPSYLEKLYDAKSSGYNLAPADDPREGVDLLTEAQEEFDA